MNRRHLLIHIICWGFLFIFPFFFIEHNGNMREFFGHYLRMTGVPVGFLVAFYASYLFAIPRYLFKDKSKAYYVANLVIIIVAFLSMLLWNDLFSSIFPDTFDEMRGHRPPKWPHYFQYFLSLVLFIGLSAALRMSQRWVKSEAARREAEKSRTESELKNLRNQLNPHFLLNTLNNIYALIAFDAEKAQTVVEELSKLLRHVLYDNQENFVPLYREVEFMKNYIELMRIRVTPNVNIETQIDIASDDSTPIAPLIFISLIENAFKHGISPSEPSFIHIYLAVKDGDIICEIRNSNYPKNASDKSGSGIGLEQVSKRLELMYPHRYLWEKHVSEDRKEYDSKIIIYHDTDMCNR